MVCRRHAGIGADPLFAVDLEDTPADRLGGSNDHDALLHRVLDLKVADGNSTTPVTAVTATSSSGGGGVVSGAPPTRLQLVKQYASSTLLAQMKSMGVDSPNALANVLTQNPSATMSLTSFSVAQQNGCS